MSDTFPLKSLWQRKINHKIQTITKITVTKLLWKQTKKDRNEEVTTDLVHGWKNGTEVQKVRNTRGVMVVHAHFTGLHCTTWSNHWKIFYHAQNANDVEPPTNDSGKACREHCKHWPVREARYIRPLTPQVCKHVRNVLLYLTTDTVTWMSIYNNMEAPWFPFALGKAVDGRTSHKSSFIHSLIALQDLLLRLCLHFTFTTWRVLILTSEQRMTATNFKTMVHCNSKFHR